MTNRFKGELSNTAFQPCQFLPQDTAPGALVLSHPPTLDCLQPPDTVFEPTTGDRANLQSKVPQQTPQGEFQSDEALLHSLTSAKQGANFWAETDLQ